MLFNFAFSRPHSLEHSEGKRNYHAGPATGPIVVLQLSLQVGTAEAVHQFKTCMGRCPGIEINGKAGAIVGDLQAAGAIGDSQQYTDVTTSVLDGITDQFIQED